MSVLKQLQQQVADQLTAHPDFSIVPVLTENLLDLDSEMDINLGPELSAGGTRGLVALVTTPMANVNWPEVGGPFFDRIPIAIHIWENVQTNRVTGGTQIPASDLAESVCKALHQFYPLSANGCLVPEPNTIRLVKDDDFLRYMVVFKCMAGLREAPPQLPAVTFVEGTPSGGNAALTMACTTPGAAIFYVTDNSNASPRNPNSSFYLTPPTLAVGTIVTARAWLAGYDASPPAKFTLA